MKSKEGTPLPHFEGKHKRGKECPYFFISTDFYMVHWHRSTLSKCINETANSDLPAFSPVQTTSLLRVLYHRTANRSPENSETREWKSALWRNLSNIFEKIGRIPTGLFLFFDVRKQFLETDVIFSDFKDFGNLPFFNDLLKSVRFILLNCLLIRC